MSSNNDERFSSVIGETSKLLVFTSKVLNDLVKDLKSHDSKKRAGTVKAFNDILHTLDSSITKTILATDLKLLYDEIL